MTLQPVRPKPRWYRGLEPASPDYLTPPPISSVREPFPLFIPTARLDPSQVEDRRLEPAWAKRDPNDSWANMPPGPIPYNPGGSGDDEPDPNASWQTVRGLVPHISPPHTGDAGLTDMVPRTALDPVSPETPAPKPVFTPQAYDPNVEQWRSRIEARMPAALRNRPDAARLVDKALWVVNGESGGDPTVPDHSGKSSSYGLFQDLDGRKAGGPDGQIDQFWGKVSKNPDNWTDWNQDRNTYDPGDGTTPQVWGSLGVNPYPGDPGGGALAEHLSTGATSFPSSTTHQLTPADITLGRELPPLPDYGQIAAGEAGQQAPYSDQSATTGVDAPAGSLRARLEAERAGQDAYGGLVPAATGAFDSLRQSTNIPGVTPALEAVQGGVESGVRTGVGAGVRAGLSVATGGPVVDALSGDLPLVGGPDLTKNVPVLGDALEKRKALIHGASDAAGNVAGGLAGGLVPTTGLDIALTAPELALKAPELALQLPGAVARAGRGGLERAALSGLEEGALARAPEQAGVRTVARQGGQEIPVRGAQDLLPVGGGAMSPAEMYAKARGMGMTDEEIAANFGQSAVDAGRGVDVAGQRAAVAETAGDAAAHAARREFNKEIDASGDVEAATAAARKAAARAEERVKKRVKPNVLADDDVRTQMAEASQRMRAEAEHPSSPLDAEPYVAEPGTTSKPEQLTEGGLHLIHPDAPLKPNQVVVWDSLERGKAAKAAAEARMAERDAAAADNPLQGLIEDVRDGLRRTKDLRQRTVLEVPANSPEAASLGETAGQTVLPKNLPPEAAGPLGVSVGGGSGTGPGPTGAAVKKPYKFNPLSELAGLVGAFRTLPASSDAGQILRQMGVGGARSPGIWKDAVVATAKAVASGAEADAIRSSMESDPMWDLIKGAAKEQRDYLADARYKRGGGLATDSGMNNVRRPFGKDNLEPRRVDKDGNLLDDGASMKVYGSSPGQTHAPGFDNNDSFVASQIAKIPWIKGTERGVETGLNVQGYLTAKKWIEPMLQAGLDAPEDLGRYRAVLDVINHMRGYSGSKVADVVGATQLLFSAQYTASRFHILADPFVYWKYPEARQLATQNLLAFMGENASMMMLMGMSGATVGQGKWSVNGDPRDSDFGQFRAGNTRVDTMAGFGPLFKTTARIMAKASDAAGVTSDAGEDVKEIHQSLLQFFENKESPVARMITDYLLHNGKTPDLKDPKSDLAMVTPMLAWDIYDAITQNNGANKALAVPAAILSGAGAGASTYKTPVDVSNELAQQTSGKKYDELAPLEKLPVIDKLPEKGSDGFEVQAPVRTAARKSMDEALTKAGYATAPKDAFEADDVKAAREASNAEVLRKNPELAVQQWYFSHPPVTKGGETKPGGGSLPTAAAVDQALKLGLPNREVKLAGADRDFTADPDSQRFWQKYGADAEYYLHDIVSEKASLDQVAAWKAGQTGGESYRDPKTKKPLTYDQLPGAQQSAVKSEIRDAAKKDANLEAVIAFMGIGGSSDKGVKTYTLGSKAAQAEYQKLQAEFPQAKDLGNIVTARNAK